MTLADWLKEKRIPHYRFARTIGISAPYLTHLCKGRHWPSRVVSEKIREATGGAVTPNDFLPPLDCQAAPAERGS